MPVLRIPVECCRCNKMVEKANARFLTRVKNERKYECFSCYKLNRNKHKEFVKRELYCERCRYKFKSKKLLCPYCNRSDNVVKGEVTVKDLL